MNSKHFFDFHLGYPKEKELYRDMFFDDFVERLLTKRCVTFVGPQDAYQLLTGRMGYGFYTYGEIGKDSEQEPLLLSDCLSYDEIKVRSYTQLNHNLH